MHYLKQAMLKCSLPGGSICHLSLLAVFKHTSLFNIVIVQIHVLVTMDIAKALGGWLYRRVVTMVQRRYPASELLAAGWSLGGNILVRYLGEEGSRCPISAAASLCNPLDLVCTPLGPH